MNDRKSPIHLKKSKNYLASCLSLQQKNLSMNVLIKKKKKANYRVTLIIKEIAKL